MTYQVGQAYLAFKVYGINAVDKGSVVTAPDGSRFQVILTDSRDNGYQGALLKNLATGKYEFVNRGTEPKQGGDANADLQMGMGALPDQVQSARAFLLKAKAEVTLDGGNPNTDLSISGHSLGGAITQVLASENPQLPANAFNPYGAGNLIPAGDYPNITNHVMARDPVSVMPGSKMPGNTVMYLEPDNATGDTSSAFASHGSGMFLIPSVIAQSGKPVLIDVPFLEGISGDPATGMPWPGTTVANSPTGGGSAGNVSDRIKPVGTVVIDESQKIPLTSAQITQNIANGYSPNGKEPLGQQISDGPGKSHSWQRQDDGSVVRVAQENFIGGGGTRVTVTTYPEGESAPSQERQTVTGTNGIVSDALLKPDGTGAMVVDKIQLGGVLETSTTATPRPPSDTFVTPVDRTHVTLGKDGTVSDIVLLQNRAGNPITADDVRAANPELNINAKFTNVRPGATLQVPVRVGDNLVTTTTLSGDTEGIKLDTIKVVGVDGELQELKVGSVLVHEGYQGMVRVNSKGEIVADDDPAADNRWVAQRINNYEFNAAHLSDWEGTADQDQHRHGGGNVAGASTETAATGATSMGAVLGKENVKTATTVDVGDKRIHRARCKHKCLRRVSVQSFIAKKTCRARGMSV